MSLNQLFRNAKKAAALKKAALVMTVAASAVGIILTKTVNSNGTGAQTSSSVRQGDRSSSAPESFAAFAATPLVPPSAVETSRASNFDSAKCLQNPSVNNCNNDSLSQGDWDRFLPPEGIVLRDGRGKVIFKKCRGLTEGAKNAKFEMEQERARFDKFNTAMTLTISSAQSYREDSGSFASCDIKSKKMAPKEEPCPTLKNYTEMKDFYRQQYYEMSNELHSQAKINHECIDIRDQVMAAADPTWKNDRGIASLLKATRSATANKGVQ
jgi:hypothetical protein